LVEVWTRPEARRLVQCLNQGALRDGGPGIPTEPGTVGNREKGKPGKKRGEEEVSESERVGGGDRWGFKREEEEGVERVEGGAARGRKKTYLSPGWSTVGKKRRARWEIVRRLS